MKRFYQHIKETGVDIAFSYLIVSLTLIGMFWPNTIAFCQSSGDYRSLNTGNWATASNWETFNGSIWTSASTYPGENAGSYTVTILAGDTITLPNTGISTSAMGSVVINGMLLINGGASSQVTYSLNTPLITITGGLTPAASINFNNKIILSLPADAVLKVWTNGLIGTCNNNQDIRIGGNVFAACNGAPGDIFTFAELMAGGGTINAVSTPSTSNICLGSTINLAGSYTGAIVTTPTYSWSNTGPEALTFTPSATEQNTAITPTTEGTYVISLTTTTINDGTSYSNTERDTIYVNKISTAPTSAVPGIDSVMLGRSTTLTLAGGGGGTNEVIKWYTSSCGGTLVGTGNGLSVSPTVETTYYGRYEDPSPCSYNSSCAQTTVKIKEFSSIWKGTLSTDFGTAGNWVDNMIPLVGQNIIFDPDAANDCILDSNRTIKNITNTTSKHLNTSSYNFTISGTISFSGTGKIDATTSGGTLTLTGSSAQSINSEIIASNTIDNLNINNSSGVTLTGNLTVSQTLTLSNGTFSIGSNTLTLNGGITKSSGSLDGSSSSNLTFGGSGATTTLSAITLNNLTLNRASGLSLDGSVDVHGSLSLTNGTLTIGANTLNLLGTTPVKTSGIIDASNSAAIITFSNPSPIVLPTSLFSGSVNSLILNGAGGITLSDNLSISKSLQFNNGKIKTGSNRVILENTAQNVIGANSNNYIVGFCRKIGNTAFTFPVGDSNYYAPISISAANGGGSPTDHFTASYNFSSPNTNYDITQHDASIFRVSSLEYWILDRVGTNNVSVTLSWGSHSIVSYLATLLVARWDGSTWKNYGNASTTGNTASGTITSSIVSDFSPFTLGSNKGNTNILPIEMVEFSVDCANDKPNLKWTTASELNNDYFEIEQSTDALNWKSIILIQGAGNSNTVRNYQYTDQYSPESDYFYRIKSVDYDGTSHYSKLVFNKSCKISENEIFKLYPSPSKGMLYLNFSGDKEQVVKIEIYNLIGELVYSSDSYIYQIDFSNQPKGTYYAIVHYGSKQIVEKFSILK